MIIFLCTVATLLFGYLSWKEPKHALYLLPILLPTYLIRFSVGPIPFTLLELFILVLTATWITSKRAATVKLAPKFFGPISLLILASILGLIAAEDTLSALGIWKAYFLEPLLVFLILQSTFTKITDWKRLLISFGVSAMILSLIGITQYVFNVGIPVPWDIERRVTSLFDYPNALGLFLAPVATISFLQALFFWKERKTSLFWLISFLLSMTGIVLAKTEAALVAVPAAIFIALLLSNVSKQKKYILAFFAIIMVISAIAIPLTRNKILLQDYSGQARLSQWQETAQLIADNPLFGAGLNSYPSAIVPYHDFTTFEIFQYPHNIVFNIWVELGLAGVIAFFWLGLVSVQQMKGRKQDHLVIIAFAALLTMTVHGFVDVPYFKNDLSVLTWIFLALLTQNISQKKPEHEIDK